MVDLLVGTIQQSRDHSAVTGEGGAERGRAGAVDDVSGRALHDGPGIQPSDVAEAHVGAGRCGAAEGPTNIVDDGGLAFHGV